MIGTNSLYLGALVIFGLFILSLGIKGIFQRKFRLVARGGTATIITGTRAIVTAALWSLMSLCFTLYFLSRAVLFLKPFDKILLKSSVIFVMLFTIPYIYFPISAAIRKDKSKSK